MEKVGVEEKRIQESVPLWKDGHEDGESERR